MAWIRRYKQNKTTKQNKTKQKSLFPNFSWFQFCIFKLCTDDYVCFINYSHILLCWKKSCVQDFFVKIALISCWNDFSLIPSEKCVSQRRAMKICKNFQFWQFWECCLFNIRRYAFQHNLTRFYTARAYHTSHLRNNLLFFLKKKCCTITETSFRLLSRLTWSLYPQSLQHEVTRYRARRFHQIFVGW